LFKAEIGQTECYPSPEKLLEPMQLKEFSFICPVIESAAVLKAIETAISPDARSRLKNRAIFLSPEAVIALYCA
jgi:hypothetical protein